MTALIATTGTANDAYPSNDGRSQRDDRVAGTFGCPLADYLGDEEPDDDDASDWHIRGIVARDVINVVGGDAKVGKTLLVESCAVALAMGATDWCGLPVYGRKRVLLMPREDADRTTRQRLWQLARGAGLDRPHALASHLQVDSTTPLNLGQPSDVAWLRAACDHFDVIFVDSLATSHTGDENAAKDIVRVMEPLRILATVTKTSIVLVHHYNGKGGKDDRRSVKHRLRGSSAIGSYARHLVGVAVGPAAGELVISSDGNFLGQLEPTVIARTRGFTASGNPTLRFTAGEPDSAKGRDVGDAIVRLVAQRPHGWSSANEIAAASGMNRTKVLNAVRRELEPGGRLERRDRRIHCRLVVPGTEQNQLEPTSGSGSPPLGRNREPKKCPEPQGDGTCRAGQEATENRSAG